MKAALLLFLAFASSLVCAQRTDTTEVKNGRYSVFQRDALGNPKNPVAVYDTTGRLLSRVSWRDGLVHGRLTQYDSLGRRTWMLTYKKGKKQGVERYYYPDGTVQYESRQRKHAVHGKHSSYHPNGKVEWRKAYRHGKLHGERILRDSTGALHNGEYVTRFPLGRGSYTTTCVNGRPQGPVVARSANGTVIYMGQYKDGLPDGEWTFFRPDGTVSWKEQYSNGKFISSTRPGDYRGPELEEDP